MMILFSIPPTYHVIKIVDSFHLLLISIRLNKKKKKIRSLEQGGIMNSKN